MVAKLQPIISTPDLDRLISFYTALLGATETMRVPEDGTTFFVGLRIDDTEFGIVADEEAETGAAGRILLSAEVEAVDLLLERVEALGGRVKAPPNDMPWGQRVAHVEDPDGNALNLTQTT